MQQDFSTLEAIRRREFLLAEKEIYLDNAGRGLLPRSHVEAVEKILRAMSEEVTLGNPPTSSSRRRASARPVC